MSHFNQNDDQYYNSVITQNVDQDMASPSQNSPMGSSSATASSQPKSGSSTETSGQAVNIIFFSITLTIGDLTILSLGFNKTSFTRTCPRNRSHRTTR